MLSAQQNAPDSSAVLSFDPNSVRLIPQDIEGSLGELTPPRDTGGIVAPLYQSHPSGLDELYFAVDWLLFAQQ